MRVWMLVAVAEMLVAVAVGAWLWGLRRRPRRDLPALLAAHIAEDDLHDASMWSTLEAQLADVPTYERLADLYPGGAQ